MEGRGEAEEKRAYGNAQERPARFAAWKACRLACLFFWREKD